MPGLTEISLAVIAAASVIAVLAAIPAIVQMRRTAARAERLFTDMEDTLPTLLTEVRALVARTDRTLDATDRLIDSVERMDRLLGVAGRTVEQAGAAMRYLTTDVGPSVANAASLFSALREGIQWIWSRRERRGEYHDRTP
jgi:uncharacterized protein YoxC